jgi:raffinose/stachyose/melibiose transport system substrate-binding protein
MTPKLWPKAGRIAALVLVLVVGSMAAACGGSSKKSSTTASTQPTVVVKWLTHNPAESSAAEKAADQLVDKFNAAHPNIKVERESISRDELNAVIKTRLQSNDAPDIFQYGTGPAFSGALANAGLLRPIDDLYKRFGWNIYPWAKAQVVYGGHTIGLPDQIETLGVYYNKDMFAKFGLQPPTTIEQLTADCAKIKAAGKICLDFANKDQWPGASMFSMAVAQTLGRKGLDDILRGSGSWDTPQVTEAIRTIFTDFEKQGFYPPSLNGIAYDDASSLFYAGKAAMLPTGSWLTAEVVQSAKFDVGFIPFPSFGNGTPALASGIGDGWYISAKSKHPEAAAEFLKFWFSQPTGQTQLQAFNTVPAFPVDANGLNLPPLFAGIVDQIKNGAGTAGYNLDTITPDAFNQEMYKGFQEVLNGKRSAEQEAAALEQAWQKSKNG